MNRIIISTIGFLISVGLFFLVVMPIWSSIETLKEEISQKNEKLSQLDKLLVRTEELKGEYQAAQEELEKIFLALPEKEELPRLLMEFRTLASANGMLLESVGFSQTEEKEKVPKKSARAKGETEQSKRFPFFPSLGVKLQLTGPYEAFKGYLRAIEKNVRLIDVRSISFSAGKTEEEGGLLLSSGVFDFNLEMDVYYNK
jgi:Tfp pilus assembly protein PilO